MTDHDEFCDRCGCKGEDRRTLWMACFYAMDELNVPFGQVAIHGHACQQTGTEKCSLTGRLRPTFAPPPDDSEPRQHQFFTLRVCKRCRAEWMGVIEKWFETKPTTPDDDATEFCEDMDAPPSTGTGVFVRRHGVNVELTPDEVEQYRRENAAEPVRVPRREELHD